MLSGLDLYYKESWSSILAQVAKLDCIERVSLHALYSREDRSYFGGEETTLYTLKIISGNGADERDLDRLADDIAEYVTSVNGDTANEFDDSLSGDVFDPFDPFSF